MRTLLVKPWVIGVLVLAVARAGFGLYWFQPWKLWQDETVQEALPETVNASKTSTPAMGRICACG